MTTSDRRQEHIINIRRKREEEVTNIGLMIFVYELFHGERKERMIHDDDAKAMLPNHSTDPDIPRFNF